MWNFGWVFPSQGNTTFQWEVSLPVAGGGNKRSFQVPSSPWPSCGMLWVLRAFQGFRGSAKPMEEKTTEGHKTH